MKIVYDEIKTETKEAHLFKIGDDDEWIPKSVTLEICSDWIEIEDWFVIAEGLEGYVYEF